MTTWTKPSRPPITEGALVRRQQQSHRRVDNTSRPIIGWFQLVRSYALA